MFLFYILLLIQVFCPSSVHARGASQNCQYPAFCELASRDEQVFSTFRGAATYRDIVETLSYGQGVQFLDEINERFPHLLPYFDKICEEDDFGKPMRYFFPSIGTCSPTVLRYVKVAGDLQHEFGDLKSFHIVEIGGGYGGQCKILNDLGGFASYTIIDIPECTSLISKYLSNFSIKNVKTINNTELREPIQCDLLISNYAFSEIDRKEQWSYIEKVVGSSLRGYMIYNPMPPIDPLLIDEFADVMASKQKTVKITREDPSRTGDIVIWQLLKQ